MAIDFAELNIAKINSQNWQFEGIRLLLTPGKPHKSQTLSLYIKKLTLPKPLDDIRFVDIRCGKFIWKPSEISCRSGLAHVESKHWPVPSAQFAFAIKGENSTLTLNNLAIAGGKLHLQLAKRHTDWQLVLTGNAVNSPLLKAYLPQIPFTIKGGIANFKALLSAKNNTPQQLELTCHIKQGNLQKPDGLFAIEKLALSSQLSAKKNQDHWAWRNRTQIRQGGIYIDPIYIEAGPKPIETLATGTWRTGSNQVIVQSLRYVHPGHVLLNGQGIVDYGKTLRLTTAELQLDSLNFNNLFSAYIKPYFDPLTFEGTSVSGHSNAKLTIQDQQLQHLNLVFEGLSIQDQRKRLQIKEGSGQINWSSNPLPIQLSNIAWQRLSLFKIPVGETQLTLSTWGKNLRLIDRVKLPSLGGDITLKEFSWQNRPNQEPNIAIAGYINQISLEKLSQALGWKSLSGSITGHIPGIHYRQNTLHLGGEITIRAFDGIIKLTNLASKKLFSELPIVYSDFEIANLDLDQLTRKFEFGNITGRLSGYVKNLVLENWQPSQFYAWFSTPQDDSSKHRISQKAVSNIAQIGGNAAADLLSRSYLSFFESFGYDKIGIGCYLNQDICQMMGLEAIDQGFYIIKGGGLPRIDVIGYHTRVDWPVLVERLKRLSHSDQVIVK